MAELSDPGNTGYGSNYVEESPYLVPRVEMSDPHRIALSLTGDNVIGQKSEGAGSGAQSPQGRAFRVQPSEIRAHQQKILDELSMQADAYESFRRLILNTEGWIFLVESPEQMDQAWRNEDDKIREGMRGRPWGDTPLEARFKDPNPSTTQATVDGQNALLRAVADSLTLVGNLVAALNNAAQNYVAADRAAFGSGDPNVEGLPRG